MQRCNKCHVDLIGDYQFCPLCQNSLEGTPEENKSELPRIGISSHWIDKVMNWIGFGAVVVCVIALAINYLAAPYTWWSLFVVAGVFSLWVSCYFVIRKRRNVAKGIVWILVIISVLSVLWDVFTGFHHWSVNYVLPILSNCSIIAIYLFARIKKLELADYLIYIILAGFFAVVALVLILTNVVTVIIPSVICVVSGLLLFSGLLFFDRKLLFNEIQRRLHL